MSMPPHLRYSACYFILLLNIVNLELITPLEENQDYWKRLNEEEIQLSLQNKQIEGEAKNVILFLGDGMGVTTVTAARIFKGQLKKRSGEEGYLTFDRFPNLALLKTYNVDRQVPDSAATATAYLTGIKANMRTVGVDANVQWSDCRTYHEKHNARSFLVEAAAAGKSVGIVTTTRITHATPAGAYAHTPSRKWESDIDKEIKGDNFEKPQHDKTKCLDIAQQLVAEAFKFNVLMGGGRRKFLPSNVTDPVKGNLVGDREDGRDLIDEWLTKHNESDHRAAVAYTGTELRALDLDKIDYLLGLFSHDHLEYEEKRVAHKKNEPSLTEMTTAALKILKRNPKGYALLVEGGRIDHGHHANRARAALSETVSFDKAIASTVKETSERDTLIMVTADHSHVFTMGSYPSRGHNILGKTDYVSSSGVDVAHDEKPVTTLLYANGQTGIRDRKGRKDISKYDTTARDYRFQSLVPLESETHGGEDVAVFARGPWAHLFNEFMNRRW
jgi:alkaline phosphatase